MKVIIAGWREYQHHDTNIKRIDRMVLHLPAPITHVISGMARGVDTSGEIWANLNNIPIIRMPADWQKHGKRAGVLRNAVMAETADALLLLWEGGSPGSQNMLTQARAKGMPIVQCVSGNIITENLEDTCPTATRKTSHEKN